MATFIFDGTANVTATKNDTVVISANPALFSGVSETGGGANSVFTYSNGNTLTITGAGVAPGNYPNVSVPNGTFSVASTGAVTANTANALVFAPTGSVDATGGSSATGIKAIFGGLGRSDPNDTADTITVGGKGSLLVYGNAGDDTVQQTDNTAGNAFDSSSAVTVFGGKGNDTLNFANSSNLNAKFAIYGGENLNGGSDNITVFNTGTSANTAIFGGQGAADSADGADTIIFNGGGVVTVYGNAGDDAITLGGAGGLAASSNATVYGGLGKDNIAITVNNANATVVAYGSENQAGVGNEDSITVVGNSGTTVIYGGTAAADSADGNDIISYTGQGTATIYAAGGDDTVNLFANGTTVGTGAAITTASASSTTTVFGGNGADSINVFSASTATGNFTLTGGAGADSFGIGVAGSVTENTVVTFGALTNGQTEVIGGLTFTAGAGGASAAQVAAAFANLATGSAGNASAVGTFSGTLTAAFNSGAASAGNTVTFSSNTPYLNVANLGAVDGGTGPATGVVTQGVGNGALSGNGTITINDFTVGAGNDTLRVDNGDGATSTTAKFTIVDGSSAQTLQTALNAAVSANSNAAGGAAGVVYQGSAYVVINHDGNTTFDATTDLAVKLTGVTDLAALNTATIIS